MRNNTMIMGLAGPSASSKSLLANTIVKTGVTKSLLLQKILTIGMAKIFTLKSAPK